MVVVEVVGELEVLVVQEVLVVLVVHHTLQYLVLQVVLVVPYNRVIQGVPLVP